VQGLELAAETQLLVEHLVQFGRDNNLKKQRDKIEDAAGDRVADIVRGKKEK
jgi:hypothetical protein